jgi:hypothetical protein
VGATDIFGDVFDLLNRKIPVTKEAKVDKLSLLAY